MNKLIENEQAVIYLNSERYSVVYIIETTKYVVTDRNLERVDKESYETAALAIAWAEDSYKGLV